VESSGPAGGAYARKKRHLPPLFRVFFSRHNSTANRSTAGKADRPCFGDGGLPFRAPRRRYWTSQENPVLGISRAARREISGHSSHAMSEQSLATTKYKLQAMTGVLGFSGAEFVTGLREYISCGTMLF